jgi:hypothetical protein
VEILIGRETIVRGDEIIQHVVNGKKLVEKVLEWILMMHESRSGTEGY